MKSLKSKRGPFPERPHFESAEIEKICTAELKAVDLLPSTPQAVRIDRFIEKRFGVTPAYLDLPEGVLGLTTFGEGGVESVVVSRALEEEGTAAAARRIRTTLAHEAGHGLLHAHLFALGTSDSLFENEATGPKILCRDVQGVTKEKYDGRWWEFQANRAIGALLMPRGLVVAAVADFLEPRGVLNERKLLGRRADAIRELSGIFDVNPVVVTLRLGELYPGEDGPQPGLF